jgi:hypothetical protein
MVPGLELLFYVKIFKCHHSVTVSLMSLVLFQKYLRCQFSPCLFELFREISSHPAVFFSHNKPANSTFSHNNPAKRTGCLQKGQLPTSS